MPKTGIFCMRIPAQEAFTKTGVKETGPILRLSLAAATRLRRMNMDLREGRSRSLTLIFRAKKPGSFGQRPELTQL